jgi:hypothetical protein
MCCAQNHFHIYERGDDGENAIRMEINGAISVSMHWKIVRPAPCSELAAATLQPYLQDACPMHSSETLTRLPVAYR